jgi:hypothetical protein
MRAINSAIPTAAVAANRSYNLGEINPNINGNLLTLFFILGLSFIVFLIWLRISK